MAKILDRLLGKSEKQQLIVNAGDTFKLVSGYEPTFTSWQGEIYESALVRSAIDVRSRHISKLRLEFVGIDNDLTRRLKIKPNPWDTWSQFLYRVNTILDCCNNCVIIPIYDAKFNQIGIYPVLPTKVKVVSYKDELWITYDFQNGRKRGACRLQECSVLRKFQFKNDFFGTDNTALDDTMDLISISQQGIEEAVKTTASYKFMARVNNFQKLDDLKKERENFTEAVFGKEAKNKGGLLLFPNTYSDIKQINLQPYTPDKDQLELIQKNVSYYFGVNEKILQNLAVGDEWSAFYEGCVEVFAIQLSEVLKFQLFTLEEIQKGADLIFTANRLQYLSNADKLSISEKMADRGIMTINELREIWNLAPIEGGDVLPRRGEYKYTDASGLNEIGGT